MDIRFVYITAKDKEQAEHIGAGLVKEHLAACVNIIDGVRSIYWWKGKLQKENEAVLIAKTTKEKMVQLTAKVKELHTYECPCVVSLNVESGNEAFLQWIHAEVGKAKK